jgi:hypothetical protein
MPIVRGTSNRARSANIATEIAAGRPVKQAVAIGYSEQREARKKRQGAEMAALGMKGGR